MTKFSKEMIDAKVEFILRTKEVIKDLEKRIEDTKKELETQYVKPVSESEEVLGNEYKVKKTARDLGKNQVDYTKAAELLTPEQLALVEKKIIDVEKLKALIKVKIIDGKVFSVIKTSFYTFATSFDHIENVKKIIVELPNKTKEPEVKSDGFLKKLFTI